jgi:hypothetical protein
MVLGLPGRVCRCQFSEPHQFLLVGLFYFRSSMLRNLIPLLFFSVCANAQLFDSTKVGIVAGQPNNYYDTLLTIDQYHQFNDYVNDDFGIISMGNQGDVRRRLIWEKPFDLAPHLGIDGYFKNYSTSSQIPYYNVRAPSGGIRLLTGYTKGQLFGLYFTVNPISRFNVYVDFQRINARGRYFNQENKSDQLKLSSSYYTKNEAYRFNAALSWNQSTNFEFGGIADTVAFQENTLTNRELITVQLQNSGSKVRYADLTINQDYRLLKIGEADLRLGYDFSLLNQFISFTSTDSAFNYNAIFDNASINDSISFRRVRNTAKIELTSPTQKLMFGVRHFYHTYGNDYLGNAGSNLGLSAGYNGVFGSLNAFGKFDYLLSNDFANTYEFDAGATYHLKKQNSVSVHFVNRLSEPGFFYQHFITNNFVWSNSLDRVSFTALEANLNIGLLNFSIGNQLIDNYVFLNELAIPEQANDIVNITFAELQATIPLGASFYLDNRIRYQITNAEEVIRIPNWIVRETVYFERDIFNKAARMQTGVEFQYFSNFTSESFMPATTSMYLQNDIQIGNYPYFNFLFNFKIQEFTFFLRLENITQGLFAFDYYAAPYYPRPDFALRIGANWRFFN